VISISLKGSKDENAQRKRKAIAGYFFATFAFTNIMGALRSMRESLVVSIPLLRFEEEISEH
jgi:hypothetical protein